MILPSESNEGHDDDTGKEDDEHDLPSGVPDTAAEHAERNDGGRTGDFVVGAHGVREGVRERMRCTRRRRGD